MTRPSEGKALFDLSVRHLICLSDDYHHTPRPIDTEYGNKVLGKKAKQRFCEGFSFFPPVSKCKILFPRVVRFFCKRLDQFKYNFEIIIYFYKTLYIFKTLFNLIEVVEKIRNYFPTLTN